MQSPKFIYTRILLLVAFSTFSETYFPVVEDGSDSDDPLTKVYYLLTTYTDDRIVSRVVDELSQANFFDDDGLAIDVLPSSNSYTGPGSSEYEGLALAIAEKVLEQKNASADTAIDPYVDNVINFYNNGIINRQAVDS